MSEMDYRMAQRLVKLTLVPMVLFESGRGTLICFLYSCAETRCDITVKGKKNFLGNAMNDNEFPVKAF